MMKFKVEKKGENFLVVNETTGYVKGRFKTEGEAKLHRNRLQDEHETAVGQITSAPTTASLDEIEEG